MVLCCFFVSDRLAARYCLQGGSRVVASAGEVLFFASPKKSTQKKGDPQSATPALRYGATCVGAVAGCAVELALRCARRSDNHGESDDEACALRRACSPRNRPAAGAASRGVDSRTSKQPHGPLLRSAQSAQREALAPVRGGRAKQWPVWMSDSRVPFTMRRGAQGVGRHARRSARASCSDSLRLFERRAQRVASSAARPTHEHRRLPAAKRRDAACRVALSLVTFFRRDERKLLACRATPGLRPPPRHAFQTSTPRLRQAQPERVGKPKEL